MKRLLFLTMVDVGSEQFAGVAKKIYGECDGLKQNGYDVYTLCIKNGNVVMLHDGDEKLIRKASIKFYFTIVRLYSEAVKFCRNFEIDYCYIRYPLCDNWLFGTIKRIRKCVSRIVVEIPTYPYDDENKRNHNIVARLNALEDKYYRVKLKNYVDYITTFFPNNDEIFGIPAIHIDNAVDPNKYPMNPICQSDEFNIIAVAIIAHHHRYDKLIRGISDYYKNGGTENVRFHIVGDGSERDLLERLTDELNMREHVIFYGFKDGRELDDIFAICQVGIVELGFFEQTNNEYSSCIKMGEYCARGIPMVSSTKHKSFPDNCYFHLIVDSNTDSTDVGQIIDFVNGIKDKKTMQKDMSRLVIENLTWDKQFEKLKNILEE